MFLSLKRNSLYLSLALAGCVNLPSANVSSIDSTYKLKKLSRVIKESESATVSVYQKILRPSLFSRCDYFPSDSVYSQNLAKRCGTVPSLFKTYDRFLREPDAGHLGLPMVINNHGISFVDLPPENCEF
ncbi:MAG: membrane protein insertion efficiency factor YidD [Bdellovibrionota bacterium]